MFCQFSASVRLSVVGGPRSVQLIPVLFLRSHVYCLPVCFYLVVFQLDPSAWHAADQFWVFWYVSVHLLELLLILQTKLKP